MANKAQDEKRKKIILALVVSYVLRSMHALNVQFYESECNNYLNTCILYLDYSLSGKTISL